MLKEKGLLWVSAFSARGVGDGTIPDGAAFAAEIAAINIAIEAAADGWQFLEPGAEQRQCPADSAAISAAAITRGVEQGQSFIQCTSFPSTLASATISAAVTNAAASDRASVAFAVSTAALSSFFRPGAVLTKEDGDATLAAISAAITAAISYSAAAVSAPADEDLDENED